jgi:lactoylglutathione lyase
MKVLFPAVRVSDLEISISFYEAIGIEAVGRVSHAGTRMAMLARHGEDEVTLELVERTDAGPVLAGGLDHLAIQVDDVEATRSELIAAGLDPGGVERPGGADGPRTVTLADPDGHHLELVQWPQGHPVEMTRADFADRTEENER